MPRRKPVRKGRTAAKDTVAYPGSLILVGDRLVVLSANAGLLRIVDASSAGYKERSRLEVLTRGAAAEVPPSFGAGTIFVRSEDEIVAVAVDGR